MMIDIAVQRIEHGQPLEVMADIQFLGHADATMNLHRFLADRTPGLADLHLGSRRRLGAFAIAFAKFQGHHQGHRHRLFVIDEHVDHAMLQRLELADRHAELLAGF